MMMTHILGAKPRESMHSDAIIKDMTYKGRLICGFRAVTYPKSGIHAILTMEPADNPIDHMSAPPISSAATGSIVDELIEIIIVLITAT
jgi:hypothetical protein